MFRNVSSGPSFQWYLSCRYLVEATTAIGYPLGFLGNQVQPVQIVEHPYFLLFIFCFIFAQNSGNPFSFMIYKQELFQAQYLKVKCSSTLPLICFKRNLS